MKLHEESKRYIKAFEKAKLICGYYPELKLYDYSKVIYKHPQSKVIICCPEHGEFKGKLTETCPACTFNRKIKTFIRGGADRSLFHMLRPLPWPLCPKPVMAKYVSGVLWVLWESLYGWEKYLKYLTMHFTI